MPEPCDRKTTAGDDLKIVFTADEIAHRIRQLGREITNHFPADDDLLVIGVLKGTFIFVADLVREIDREVGVDFLVAASYGSGTTTSGKVRMRYDPDTPVAGRHVLLVEDIVDTGTTVNRLVPILRQRQPKSLELCTLLRKPGSGGVVQEPRWVGFEAPDAFLIGYGLDHDERYRNLPYIASL